MRTFDFKTYVKDVLPAELIVSIWPYEALRAQAMASKHFAWWHIANNDSGEGTYNGQCFDVRDDVADQEFRIGEDYPSSNNAVDDMWSWRMTRGSEVVYTEYFQGNENGDACGLNAQGIRMNQYGAKDCAERGYSWRQILDTYYYNPSLPTYAYLQPTWFIKSSNSALQTDYFTTTFAPHTALPLMGDWNGDRLETPGYRAGGSNGWCFSNDYTYNDDDDFCISYGRSSDYPIVGDWDDNGTDTPGIVRGNQWYLSINFDTTHDIPPFYYGQSTDIPVPGDWDGDGGDTPGVFRAGTWFFNPYFDSGVGDTSLVFGGSADKPIVGHWQNDGRVNDTPGLVTHRTWRLNYGMDNTVDVAFEFGNPADNMRDPRNATSYDRGVAGDVPLPGNFDTADFVDTPALVRMI